MTPSNLASELASLKIGKPVIDWYQEEIARLRTANGPDAAGPLDWAAFQKQFLAAGESAKV